MKMLSLFRLELGRLLRSRMTWLAVVLSLAIPLAGYSLFPLLSWTTMATIYLANPISIGTLGGTLVFSVLTLYELDRVRRYHMGALIDSIASPFALTIIRVACIVACALVTAAFGFVLYLPYTAWRMDLVFSLSDYYLCWFLLFFPGLAFAAMAAAICYLITQRVDVSFLAVMSFMVISRIGEQADNTWWQWSLPNVPALSDDFGNTIVFRTAAYNRLIWLCILGGGFIFALLCLRRYGKGLVASCAQGLRRIWPAVMALCLLGAGGALWINQPFFDHSPVDWINAEDPDHTQEGVFLTGTELTVDATDTWSGTLSGTAIYHIENTTGQPQELYLDINAGYTIDSATVNGQPISVIDGGTDYIAVRNWTCTLPAEEEITLELAYYGVPKLWNVMSDFNGSIISADYIFVSGGHLAPRPELLLKTEDTPVSLKVTLPGDLTPVTSGYEAELLSNNVDGTKTWVAGDTGGHTMLLIAGDYVKADLDGGGMPIEFYYSRKHQEQLESIDAISIMEAAVAYCTEHYGPRGFTPGQPFKIIQGTEFLFGGFATYNVSAILEDSFTVKNMQDKNKGASGTEVLAHEIIHQWWGLGIMFMDMEDLYWTSEGMTTYSTYRLMEELYGADYAKTFYLDKWLTSIADASNNFYVRYPEYLERLPEEYAANIEATVNGVNLYDGTAQMIKRAEELVGGQEQMDAILSRLYQEGGTEMPPYVSLNDFLNACGLTKEAVGRD